MNSAVESHHELSSVAADFAELAERVLAGSAASSVANADLERVLTAAMKLYAAKADGEDTPAPPVSADKLTPTEAMIVISETMRALNLNLFDLSMWYRRGEQR